MFDYRPGLPLHQFLMDFVMDSESQDSSKFVGQVEQMVSSRCYRISREPNKLGCTSCHDPHELPEPQQKLAHYRNSCLQCHQEQSCRLSLEDRQEQSKDSCIACHMQPTGSIISHAPITDHRIRRRPVGPTSGTAVPPSIPGQFTLVPFRRDLDPQDEDVSRNRALAIIGMLDHGPPDARARQWAETALPLLDRALAHNRHDAPAWVARGSALWCLDRREQALAAYEKALAEEPDETTLHLAGKLALLLNRRQIGRSYVERTLQLNPWSWQDHHLLAVDSYERGDWDGAIREFQRSLELEPFNSTSRRKLLVECYLNLGQKDKASAEFETLVQLCPQGRRQELRKWFEAK